MAPLIVVLVVAATFLVHWQGTTRRAMGDTYWYTRAAQLAVGVPEPVASTRAADLSCREITRAHALGSQPVPCTGGYPALASPRYRAIFDSRPGYPLLAAPAVAVLGPWKGLALTTAALFVLLGLVTYFAGRISGLSPPASAIGACALAVLPVGYWNSRLLADGPGLLAIIVALTGGLVVLRGRAAAGVPLMITGLATACTIKPASAMAAAMALMIAGVALGVRPQRWLPRGRRRPGWVLAAVALGCLAAWWSIAHLLGLPSLTETAQDLATRHFSRPDVADPLRLLGRRAVALWVHGAPVRLGLPWPLALVLPACGYLIWRLRARGWLWTAISLAPIAVVTAHPMASEYLRLIAPCWVAVALAAGALVDQLAGLARPDRDARRMAR